jgi:hypothetical protein
MNFRVLQPEGISGTVLDSQRILTDTYIYIYIFFFGTAESRSRGSSVSIVSDYGLDDRGSISDRGRGFFL